MCEVLTYKPKTRLAYFLQKDGKTLWYKNPSSKFWEFPSVSLCSCSSYADILSKQLKNLWTIDTLAVKPMGFYRKTEPNPTDILCFEIQWIEKEIRLDSSHQWFDHCSSLCPDLMLYVLRG